MRIAIPVAAGKLAAHFGHCEQFALIDIDVAGQEVKGQEVIDAPPHQPGLLPGWLAERGVNTVIAGGMGTRALELFAAEGIRVAIGAPPEEPETIARAYLAGSLETGANLCDH